MASLMVKDEIILALVLAVSLKIHSYLLQLVKIMTFLTGFANIAMVLSSVFIPEIKLA